VVIVVVLLTLYTILYDVVVCVYLYYIYIFIWYIVGKMINCFSRAKGAPAKFRISTPRSARRAVEYKIAFLNTSDIVRENACHCRSIRRPARLFSRCAHNSTYFFSPFLSAFSFFRVPL